MRLGFPLLYLSALLHLNAQPIPTGPAVGEPIPAFSAIDHTGKTQTLDSLRGPNGLVLEFVRSADW